MNPRIIVVFGGGNKTIYTQSKCQETQISVGHKIYTSLGLVHFLLITAELPLRETLRFFHYYQDPVLLLILIY